MKITVIVLFALVVLIGAFKYVDYATGKEIKKAQLGAIGL